MAIGSHTEFLHDLGQPQIIAWDEFSALIEARLIRRCRLRPVGAEIRFLKRVLLAQLTQPQKRLMTHAKTVVTLIDHNLFHGLILSFSSSGFSASRSS